MLWSYHMAITQCTLVKEKFQTWHNIWYLLYFKPDIACIYISYDRIRCVISPRHNKSTFKWTHIHSYACTFSAGIIIMYACMIYFILYLSSLYLIKRVARSVGKREIAQRSSRHKVYCVSLVIRWHRRLFRNKIISIYTQNEIHNKSARVRGI